MNKKIVSILILVVTIAGMGFKVNLISMGGGASGAGGAAAAADSAFADGDGAAAAMQETLPSYEEAISASSEPQPPLYEVEIVEGNRVIEKQAFSGELLSESDFIKSFVGSQSDKNKPLQIQAKYMHGLPLSELHNIMNIISRVNTLEDKENAVIKYLTTLLKPIGYPPFPIQMTAMQRQILTRESKNIKWKNREIKYAPLNKAIALIQVAQDLKMPSVEAGCVKMIADYLSINYENLFNNPLPDPYKKQFLDNLYALPINIQNKISNLFLLDSLHSGDRIKKINQFFIEKTTEHISHDKKQKEVGDSEQILNWELFKLRRELFSIPLNQLIFIIELLKPLSSFGYQHFKTHTNNKIVLTDPNHKALFESLPGALKKVFDDKIAKFNAKFNYYY